MTRKLPSPVVVGGGRRPVVSSLLLRRRRRPPSAVRQVLLPDAGSAHDQPAPLPGTAEATAAGMPRLRCRHPARNFTPLAQPPETKEHDVARPPPRRRR